MNMELIKSQIHSLQQDITSIDRNAKVSMVTESDILKLNVESTTNDKLTIVVKDFDLNEDYEQFSPISESKFLYLEHIHISYEGVKYLETVLKYLDSRIVLILLVPEPVYSELSPSILNVLISVYEDFMIQLDLHGVKYKVLKSVETII
ncbi:hypothetical protein JCM10914A_02680 [Paenibacillus sp. JCM 10914]